MWTESPLIKVRVNKPHVDVIHVSTEKGLGWKLDGLKGDELVVPDELQDHFEWIVHELAKYVDETSVWINADTEREISAWEAMTLLTKVDDEDDE
jgi:hypothetical protein